MDNKELFKTIDKDLSSETEEIRFSAVRGLIDCRSEETVPLLIKAAGDVSYRVREEALKGLSSFPDDRIFPRLEEFLRDHTKAKLRSTAMEVFPLYGKKATPYLLPLLKDEDRDVRLFTANIFSQIKDPESVNQLIEALNDPDENVKHASAESLGKIGDARAVGPLVECLNQDFWIQYSVIMALGEIGDISATKHLVGFINDEMVREPVMEALGKIGDISVIPVFADILSQNDPMIRNTAIAALINIQRRVEPDGACLPSIKTALSNVTLIDHLLNSLNDPEPEVKKNAIIALGWLQEKKAVGKLLELLSIYDLEEYIVGALISIGEGDLSALTERLENPDPKIKTSLIRCIDWIGSIDGIKACIPFLKDEDKEVRYHAIMTMAAGVELEEVEDALVGLLYDPDPEIREMLIEILGRSRSKRLTDKLLLELDSEIYTRRLNAIQILGKLQNQRACAPLKRLLEGQTDEVRAYVYSALSSILADNLPKDILHKGLIDKSPMVRRAVAHSIEHGMDENLKNTLYELLSDPDTEVRTAVIETLGRKGDASAIKHFIDIFQNCDKKDRLTILEAMGNIQDKSCRQFLVHTLRGSDPDLKRTALESLGKLRDKTSIPYLIIALDDPDWRVRIAAIQALAKIGDKRCEAHILKRIDDPKDIIKKEVLNALYALNATDAVNKILPLIQNENLQLEVISTLEKLGIPDLEFFYDFFRRSSTMLKCRLVELLGRLKGHDVVEFLTRLLQNEFFTVRCSVAKALGEIRDPMAIPSLLKIQKEDPEDDVRREAALALKKLEAGK
ncbi:HEAT repeat domain-containing protein [bacterium]|nr:HEAT repeat domain-containing protein [bacterium]